MFEKKTFSIKISNVIIKVGYSVLPITFKTISLQEFRYKFCKGTLIWYKC